MDKFDRFVDIIKTLRSPKGCPWDRKQKPHNYKAFFLEEVYELIESIDGKDFGAVKEELGDVLLLVVMLSQIYSERGKFSINDVIEGISDKLILRHPHVFSKKKLKTAEEVLKNWISAKHKEKKRTSLKERLPRTAPALLKAMVFFKELKYNSFEDYKFSPKILSCFSKKNINHRDFPEILLYLSYLASKKKINLEEALREKVDTAASRFKYAEK